MSDPLKRVRERLANPPPESAILQARSFGVDLSLTTRNMFGLTPTERLELMQSFADVTAEMRRGLHK